MPVIVIYLCRKLYANIRLSVSTVIGVLYIYLYILFIYTFMQYSLNLYIYSKYVVALNSVLQKRLYDENC